jgi:hypothetical protein
LPEVFAIEGTVDLEDLFDVKQILPSVGQELVKDEVLRRDHPTITSEESDVPRPVERRALIGSRHEEQIDVPDVPFLKFLDLDLVHAEDRVAKRA